MDDLEINNSNTKDRSAINLNDNSTLNLYVYGNTTVNSSFGEDAANDNSRAIGKGGYAGIHVPENATLNLFGDGVIKAYGGSASDGGTYATYSDGGTAGGSGGGGAGAGIGGNGGNGRSICF